MGNQLFIPEHVIPQSLEFAAPNVLGDVNVDLMLTDFLVRYRPTGFVAPILVGNVEKTGTREAYTYRKFEKANAFRKVDDRRAPGTEAKQILIKGSKATGLLEERALCYRISDREMAESGLAVMDRVIPESLADALSIQFEIDVKNKLSTEANFDATHWIDKSLAQWTAATTYDTMMADIDIGVDVIVQDTGVAPTHLLMVPAIARIISAIYTDKFKQNTDLLQTGIVDSVYRIPKSISGMQVVIAEAVANTSAVEDTFTGAAIWPKNLVMLRRDPSETPADNRISTLYNFVNRWRRVRSTSEFIKECKWYELSDIRDLQLVAPESAYVLESLVA